jgi:putative tricarboxylic transport membrane protein
MELIGNISFGFSQALNAGNLLFTIAGVIIGSLVGVLPGIGPLGAMSLLLGVTFGMSPIQTLLLFSGIYYGSMYGGSTTSILLNVPGEAASVITCIDGYKMTQKGRAGAALFIAAAGSFVAGTISTIGLMLFAPPLADFALRFGSPEYFAITAVGLIVLTSISSGSKLKAAIMILLGILLSTIGMSPGSGDLRFTFGILDLAQGVDFVAVAMGIFGITEVISTIARKSEAVSVKSVPIREILPNREEFRRSIGPSLRGSVVGFFIGLIPGPAAIISSFASYAVEKKISKHPEEFGNGAIEGVAGPESANNAASGAAFLPLMALGIPFAPPIALLLAALLITGIMPGPTFIQDHPDLFWVFIASMYVGNVFLLILNLPLVGIFVAVLRTPERILMPIVAVLCLIGVYAVNSSSVDVWVLVLSGAVGFILRSRGYDFAPLVLAIVLGPKLEIYLTESLSMSGGDLLIFVRRPISLAILLIPVVLIGIKLVALIFKSRDSRDVNNMKRRHV